MSQVRRGPMSADNFLMVSRRFARDARLSLKARGLGLWLFSHQDGWNLSIRSIAAAVGAGKEAVQGGLQELERYGYLRREPVLQEGRYVSMDYVVTDVSPGQTTDGFSGNGSDLGKSDDVTGKPSAGKTVGRVSGTHKETKFEGDQQPEDQENSSSPDGDGASGVDALFPAPKRADYTMAAMRAATDASLSDEFENQFWPAYPRKVGKNAALTTYRRVRRGGVTVDDVMAGLRRFVQEKANTEARFIAHASTWLNAGRWADEPDPVQAGTSGHRPYQNEDYWSTPMTPPNVTESPRPGGVAVS